MTTLLRLATAAVLFALPAASAAKAPAKEEDKVLYALGVSIAKNLEAFSLTPQELAHVQQGLADGVAGTADIDLQAYGPRIGALAGARVEKASAAQKAEGQAYLDRAATEKGAQRSQSGLIYVPIKEGTGASPTAADKVRVHYQGTLIDGTVFDSSYKRGEPISFPLNGVIPCWTEGVQKMKVGGKAKLVCPSDIAYGDRGAPPTIPPGATLVFEVELLDIQK